ncbi:uncharacterized protein BDR25DRAFT_350739 [Lindgomyces ingoldianus]|uniref:Uncharacterized protein n=1 Tax=Lindgomyces ingoldianus TaxID=673940 RepID=A0ACB6RAI5_9PLEO|nr:uncharacterized protein BDR25DRAFT_350739 [Lindgomyces ingoldianus]KAF2475355.1 hypothetical protein BDR25DRAFT_350739 [Lindgomyces ingoldianus]
MGPDEGTRVPWTEFRKGSNADLVGSGMAVPKIERSRASEAEAKDDQGRRDELLNMPKRWKKHWDTCFRKQNKLNQLIEEEGKAKDDPSKLACGVRGIPLSRRKSAVVSKDISRQTDNQSERNDRAIDGNDDKGANMTDSFYTARTSSLRNNAYFALIFLAPSSNLPTYFFSSTTINLQSYASNPDYSNTSNNDIFVPSCGGFMHYPGIPTNQKFVKDLVKGTLMPRIEDKSEVKTQYRVGANLSKREEASHIDWLILGIALDLSLLVSWKQLRSSSGKLCKNQSLTFDFDFEISRCMRIWILSLSTPVVFLPTLDCHGIYPTGSNIPSQQLGNLMGLSVHSLLGIVMINRKNRPAHVKTLVSLPLLQSPTMLSTQVSGVVYVASAPVWSQPISNASGKSSIFYHSHGTCALVGKGVASRDCEQLNWDAVETHEDFLKKRRSIYNTNQLLLVKRLITVVAAVYQSMISDKSPRCQATNRVYPRDSGPYQLITTSETRKVCLMETKWISMEVSPVLYHFTSSADGTVSILIE